MHEVGCIEDCKWESLWCEYLQKKIPASIRNNRHPPNIDRKLLCQYYDMVIYGSLTWSIHPMDRGSVLTFIGGQIESKPPGPFQATHQVLVSYISE